MSCQSSVCQPASDTFADLARARTLRLGVPQRVRVVQRGDGAAAVVPHVQVQLQAEEDVEPGAARNSRTPNPNNIADVNDTKGDRALPNLIRGGATPRMRPGRGTLCGHE
eukprot:CAMPEP_0198683738 /NCGR_PEP_ID=MMETSP1468-20131203/11117_1 /TAXON_ID=1461545 /ORGANISM="Mantoniella sp, Strain CCMP1436" /LENGTH=109 /DNA_ID=CAMNT_0044427997 /DNA_START=131 /DNA_END=460 /DNA_ORIENTATION=+